MKKYSPEEAEKEERIRCIFSHLKPLHSSNSIETGTCVLTQLLGQFKCVPVERLTSQERLVLVCIYLVIMKKIANPFYPTLSYISKAFFWWGACILQK